jgi:hypothetical protein
LPFEPDRRRQHQGNGELRDDLDEGGPPVADIEGDAVLSAAR